MSGYLPGTQVEDKSGRIKIKTKDGKWIGMGRHRYIEVKKVQLTQDQRVFHIDGDRHNFDINNLVPISFNGTTYSLAHSRVIYIPKKK